MKREIKLQQLWYNKQTGRMFRVFKLHEDAVEFDDSDRVIGFDQVRENFVLLWDPDTGDVLPPPQALPPLEFDMTRAKSVLYRMLAHVGTPRSVEDQMVVIWIRCMEHFLDAYNDGAKR